VPRFECGNGPDGECLMNGQQTNTLPPGPDGFAGMAFGNSRNQGQNPFGGQSAVRREGTNIKINRR
jgi:hypothetical protein